MENRKKCSNKKHSEANAIAYCHECDIYLCNKCKNHHIELFESHQNYDLNNNNQEIFSGIYKELNHKNKLEYYCKNHNILCCAACLCKIKGKGNGQHHDCNVCLIEEIKEEKKSKLKENIKYLEESSKNIEESIKKMKEIYEKITLNKEEIKLKILNIFTKIRNMLNEREDKLLSKLDNIYDNTFFKEDLIKKSEKIPAQIKDLLEKGKLLDNEWNINNKDIIDRINDCINIENNIKNTIEINDNIEKYNLKKLSITFFIEESQLKILEETITMFGEIGDENNYILNFSFKPGANYNISNNGLIATKLTGGDEFNCAIIGDKEIPKDTISKWKIKINKNKDKIKNLTDYYIGIGPKSPQGNLYKECWSLKSSKSTIRLQLKDKDIDYNNHKENIKEGDIIEIIVNRKLGNLSYSINDINFGIACTNIPKEDILYPTVLLYEQG